MKVDVVKNNHTHPIYKLESTIEHLCGLLEMADMQLMGKGASFQGVERGGAWLRS